MLLAKLKVACTDFSQKTDPNRVQRVGLAKIYRGWIAFLSQPILYGCILYGCIFCPLTYAQTPIDTPKDLSKDTPKDTLATKPIHAPIGFQTFLRGKFVSKSPAETPYLEASSLLSDMPHAFRYDAGGLYRMSGWSPFGLSPNRTVLTLNGVPFNDLITGSPHFDLLPLAWLAPLQTENAVWGEGVGIHTALRELRMLWST